MTGEDKRIFVDTNVLIYANYSGISFQTQARNKLRWCVNNNFDIWICRQIIREFLVYATRYNFEGEKMRIKEFLNPIFENLEQYQIIEDSNATTTNLQILIEKHDLSGKKIHDANIVATMLSCNITKLLTNNVKDFERFKDVIEIIPLID